VYLFKKGNYYFLFIIYVSASNLYIPMIWLYVFLLDFLIPFLCDPDLQWVMLYIRFGLTLCWNWLCLESTELRYMSDVVHSVPNWARWVNTMLDHVVHAWWRCSPSF
jgi:hypothetical protein